MMDYTNNPYYQKAVEFIKDGRLEGLPVGTHTIDGDNLWVNIVETNLKPASEARLEAHNIYIDLQVPLSRDERFGVKPRNECGEERDASAENDIVFFDDPVTETELVKAGETITFTPDTAHAPLIGEGPIRKAIFKIRVV